MSELIHGMELAKQLKGHLSEASTFQTREFLMQKILSSYEKALMILNWSGSVTHPQPAGENFRVTVGIPESPLSINGSPISDDFDGSPKDGQGRDGASKKRKTMPRWTDQVKVSSENGLEGPHEDGYSWRKYGQKDILGAKYPRSYYRCTYRNTKNCWATKQVQRSDEDPTIFEITYRGTHACSNGNQSVPQPSSPEKTMLTQKNDTYHPQDALLNLQKGLRVHTENLDKKEMEFPFTFPSTYQCDTNVETYCNSFISPATPEPSYSVSPFQVNNFGGVQNFGHSESDFTEIISANTSATNSPILDLDFTLEAVELDPNFPFDTPEFFS